MSVLPLAGVRVVQFTLALAGAKTVQFWANYGADVIKVESRTHVDFMRNEEPRVQGLEGPNVSQRWNTTHGDKRGVTINMNRPGGRELALRLVATADVVLDNLVTGVMQRWGLTYEELRAVREDIIVLSMPVMGQDGPRCHFRGFGPGIQAIAGLKAITGDPDFPPAAWATPYPDFSSNPYHASVALLAALHYRARTGKGQFIDLSQYEATIQFAAPQLMEWTINRRLPPRLGNRMPGMAPHGIYRCRGDDKWVAIAVQDESEWLGLREALGNPDWTADERFATLMGRIEHEDELDELVEAWTVERTPEEAMLRLQWHGVTAGAVQSMEDLLQRDPQMRARGALQLVDHPQAGMRYYPAPAFQLSRTPYQLRHGAPLLGEHTMQVFHDLVGMPEDELLALEAQGAFE
jgi:benzylsuccinate CoA-transferase BbsF subunit